MFFSPSRKLFYDKNQYQPPKQLTAVLACGEDKKGRSGRSLDGFGDVPPGRNNATNSQPHPPLGARLFATAQEKR
jgi:hypothetical protein